MSGRLLRAVLVAGLMAGAGQAFGQVMPSPTLPPGPAPHSLVLPAPSIPMAPVLPSPPIPGLPPNAYAELTRLYQTIADLYAAGKYAQAVPVALEYVAWIEKRADDTEGLLYANAISLLSRLYQVQGQYQAAEPLLVHSLRILEDKGGAEGEVATELDALAQLYESQGQFEKAEHYFVRALVINEKNAASDPRRYGRALNNLAWVYQDQSRYAEAEPLASKALDVLAKAFGKKDSDYGCTLDTLAKLYEGQDRKTESELLYRQALPVLQAALGTEHVSTATTRENLGGLLKSMGQLAEAEQLLNQALATKERVFGGNHRTVAKTLSQLGDLYRLQGKQEQADVVFNRAFAIENGALVEIPVFFVTDRQREQDGKGVAFGSIRSNVLTFGRATVVLPEPRPTSAPPLQLPGSGTHTGGVAAARASPDSILPLVATTDPTHLAISRLTTSSQGDLLQPVALQFGIHRGEALLFVHGFNVSFENALLRAAQISYDTKFKGPVFLFSWAARESVRAYFGDNEGTVIVGEHLFDFVKLIVGETKVKKIHFIAHSMGNLVLLNALGKLTMDPSLRSVIGEIIHAAPDVEGRVFQDMVATRKGNGGNFTLYASRGDWALWASGLIRGESRAGFIDDKALIVPGVETIDVTDAGTGYFGLNHDVYASNPVLVEDMKRIFKDRKHPPDQRTETFKPVVANAGTYWRYHRAGVKADAPDGRNSVPSMGRPVVQVPPPETLLPSAGPAAAVPVIVPAVIVPPPPIAPGADTTAVAKPAVIPPGTAPMLAPGDASGSEAAKVAPAVSARDGLSAMPAPTIAPPDIAKPPAAAADVPPPTDATASITPPPAKKVQRKKRKKPDFDLTKPLQ